MMKHLGVRIDPEIHKQLKAEALNKDLTMQQLITYIVTEYLKNSLQKT